MMDVTQFLRSQKVKLIDILSADADFVLQHADSCSLLSSSGYEQVKACRIPSEKVTELLDHIIQRGPVSAQGLLELLKEPPLQETFPMLYVLKDLQVSSLASDTQRKRKSVPDVEETKPKQMRSNAPIVTEKQLMTVARGVGRSWREIGRLALEIPNVKLEQIEEDHPNLVERVFAMLNYWKIRQREKATTAYLHALLSQDDWALPPERIDFLIESDSGHL
uniref:uncharacterized protein LOC131137530 isoform X1 n=1 Tax=Doryrhamphus excisus TaxID=161450 RepID=UPI0025AE03F3|nr:uncharacterized protein LOC131137530 isoform X1 [Doryrhamphus excisus]XP_057941598.1 uncharacterized protein LOC131137530 isoform X1 [Doryrhamphus excisus]XP_057941599.1 uncharacterized protein LOC131137530 isoform X1 [Doryrhamphus excisus]XP_057941600.1 uncharacterized protein LOC131137530 isoform X1 [Doryrhamphus excisus]XP_057941601.1 uncharacterized protein LOC131137530 isoform X1 [Doryrhamphus excisus]